MSHLSESQIRQLQLNTMPMDQKLAALAHMAECEVCAAGFADAMTEEMLVTPPRDFRPTVQKGVAVQKEKEKQIKEFRGFRMRVLAAVAAALILVFSGTFRFLANADFSVISDSMTYISETLDQGFQGINEKRQERYEKNLTEKQEKYEKTKQMEDDQHATKTKK